MIYPANKLQTMVINGVRVNKCFSICFDCKISNRIVGMTMADV